MPGEASESRDRLAERCAVQPLATVTAQQLMKVRAIASARHRQRHLQTFESPKPQRLASGHRVQRGTAADIKLRHLCVRGRHKDNIPAVCADWTAGLTWTGSLRIAATNAEILGVTT
jgi:hypothetical protein